MSKSSTTPPKTPKAIRRRYQRRIAPWWTVAIVLAACALWSLFALGELVYPTPIDRWDARRMRWIHAEALARLPVDLLRLARVGDHAIAITLTCTLAISSALLGIVVLLLFRLAPPGYWGDRKK